ncbi:MAG: SDR family NAD(P)-dependent oxidoreductase, partial [Pseudomonadota bacterium]
IVSSVAGYCGLPGSAYYGPTKSALITLAETYRPELQRHGVKLQVVNPGFVKTPLTAGNSFPMPFLMELDDAVDRFMAGLQASRFEITFPRRMAILVKLVAMLPYPIYFWLMAQMSRRRS